MKVRFLTKLLTKPLCVKTLDTGCEWNLLGKAVHGNQQRLYIVSTKLLQRLYT